MRQISIARLVDDNRQRLSLDWVVEHDPEARIVLEDQAGYGADLVGHLNIIHPGRLQVIGREEIDWMARLSAVRLTMHTQDLFQGRPPAILIADGCAVPDAIAAACEVHSTPLLVSARPASLVIEVLRNYMSRRLAETVTLHGVLMDVLGMGVMITGDSGVGKSELALELISRGHGLVADDVVEMARVAPDVIEGRCPALLRDFLEVRGLGLLNIRTVFGETASRRKMRVRLVVHLSKPQEGSTEALRLPLAAQKTEILDTTLHKVILPVAEGRNLAVLLETAVRNTILQLRGIDSTQQFVERQQQALGQEEEFQPFPDES